MLRRPTEWPGLSPKGCCCPSNVCLLALLQCHPCDVLRIILISCVQDILVSLTIPPDTCLNVRAFRADLVSCHKLTFGQDVDTKSKLPC